MENLCPRCYPEAYPERWIYTNGVKEWCNKHLLQYFNALKKLNSTTSIQRFNKILLDKLEEEVKNRGLND